MANRFLDTNFFKSPFVRGLKGSLKSLYGYIICDCTASGMWFLDLEVASLYIGFPVTQDEFDENFIKTGKAIDLGKHKFFFPGFIEHQYPKGLQEKNPAHFNIIIELKKYDLIGENLILKTTSNKDPSEGLSSPIGNGNGNGKGLGKGLGLGKTDEENFEKKEKEPPKDNSQMMIPKMQTMWYETIPSYTKDYTHDYPAILEIYKFIADKAELRNIQDPKTQETVLNTLQLIALEANDDDFWRVKPLKSIAKNIQEFYNRIKEKKNGHHKQRHSKTTTTAVSINAVQAAHNKRYSTGGQAAN